MKWKPNHLFVQGKCPGYWVWVCSPANLAGPILPPSWAPLECAYGWAETRPEAYAAALEHAERVHGVRI